LITKEGEIIVTSSKGEKGEDVELRTVKDYTYGQIYDYAFNLGKSIRNRQLAFKEDQFGFNTLGVYSKNRL
jgi:hypothetical protein